jgi:NADPH2 dehydrogenase
MDFKKIPTLKSPEGLRQRLSDLGLSLPVDDTIQTAPDSPMAQPIDFGGFKAGNRWAVHPMEGWDATTDGKPTPELERRWHRFAISGAKIIWGFEAMAVRHDGRANPHQLVLNAENAPLIRDAAWRAVEAHAQHFGTSDDLFWGFQLTHSGRFSRPNRSDKLEPLLAYHHPVLDRRYKIDPAQPIATDDDLKALRDAFIEASILAQGCGARFIDFKQCHGYFGHELLGAFTRQGPYGGPSFEARTRFFRETLAGIQAACPGLIIGVRLSAFDILPYKPGPEAGRGIPDADFGGGEYRYGFGVNPQNPNEYDLTEPIALLKLMQASGVAVVNISCGSPYYNPHIQRPALYPPSDGYQPPEDPLVGVVRQAQVVRALRAAVPGLPLVSSGITYLQEFTAHVAQALVREGWTDSIGLGRMMLSYPTLIADSLENGRIEGKMICRTFSDCTTAPRNGMVSGCYPLDPEYKKLPEAALLKETKKALKAVAT